METIAITTDFITLGQFLKYIGIASTGGEAKIILREETVRVDGEVETRRGRKLYPGAIVDIAEEGTFKIVEAQD